MCTCMCMYCSTIFAQELIQNRLSPWISRSAAHQDNKPKEEYSSHLAEYYEATSLSLGPRETNDKFYTLYNINDKAKKSC